jgi:hypothetical protein
MTDKEFKKLIKDTKAAQKRYLTLLDKAENEYERRFGNNPSDVNDDNWIDTMHYPQEELNFEDMMEKAKEANES